MYKIGNVRYFNFHLNVTVMVQIYCESFHVCVSIFNTKLNKCRKETITNHQSCYNLTKFHDCGRQRYLDILID